MTTQLFSKNCIRINNLEVQLVHVAQLLAVNFKGPAGFNELPDTNPELVLELYV